MQIWNEKYHKKTKPLLVRFLTPEYHALCKSNRIMECWAVDANGNLLVLLYAMRNNGSLYVPKGIENMLIQEGISTSDLATTMAGALRANHLD